MHKISVPHQNSYRVINEVPAVINEVCNMNTSSNEFYICFYYTNEYVISLAD